jgi:hypothetical protein
VRFSGVVSRVAVVYLIVSIEMGDSQTLGFSGLTRFDERMLDRARLLSRVTGGASWLAFYPGEVRLMFARAGGTRCQGVFRNRTPEH